MFDNFYCLSSFLRFLKFILRYYTVKNNLIFCTSDTKWNFCLGFIQKLFIVHARFWRCGQIYIPFPHMGINLPHFLWISYEKRNFLKLLSINLKIVLRTLATTIIVIIKRNTSFYYGISELKNNFNFLVWNKMKLFF